MGSGLHNQMQIFWQLYIIKLLGILMCIWLLEFGSCSIFGKPMCYHATNLGLIPCGGQTVRSTNFFTLLGNTALYPFQFGKWVPGNTSAKKDPFLQKVPEGSWRPHFYTFPYYTLMTFLMMLSVILLCMLMILLSSLSVVTHLIRGNS